MAIKNDLTGKRFGRLVVLYENAERKNRKVTWHCRCDCGTEKDILGTCLTRKTQPTQSCGCLQKENTRKANQSEDLAGMRFGRLVVQKREEKSSKWKCLCDCGNMVVVDTNHLKQGHTKSCGCLQKDKASQTHLKNIIGEKYGLLTVIAIDIEKSRPGYIYWKCQCECGKQSSVSTSALLGGTISCGCKKMSRGEIKIRDILTSYNIPFEQEKTFETCINPQTKKHLRFDFFVNNSYLIEYNGKQHYQQSQWEPLEDIQYRDKLKIDWCKKNNIPLIIIPYDKFDSLTINDLLPR